MGRDPPPFYRKTGVSPQTEFAVGDTIILFTIWSHTTNSKWGETPPVRSHGSIESCSPTTPTPTPPPPPTTTTTRTSLWPDGYAAGKNDLFLGKFTVLRFLRVQVLFLSGIWMGNAEGRSGKLLSLPPTSGSLSLFLSFSSLLFIRLFLQVHSCA